MQQVILIRYVVHLSDFLLFHNSLEVVQYGEKIAISFHMARKILIKTAEAPYHVMARSNNKEFFYIPTANLWTIFIECFKKAEVEFQCNFHAFVLMSNHYHLLISTPLCNLDEIMQYVQREVARKANFKASRVNHFFGGRYKWSLVNDEIYYWNVLKYIFRNPVRSGLCSDPFSYLYSSLNNDKFSWKVTDFFHSKNKPITLDSDWICEPFLNETETEIKSGLRRFEFKLPRNKHGYLSTLDTPHIKK